MQTSKSYKNFLLDIFPVIFISVLGGASLILSTIMIDLYLDDESLREWSFFSTILWLVFIPGIYGFENIFIRNSKIIDGKVFINVSLKKYFITSFIFAYLIFIIILNNFFYSFFNILTLLLPISVTVLTISSSIERALGNFKKGIFLINLYKLATFVSITIFTFFNHFAYQNFLVVFYIIIFFVLFSINSFQHLRLSKEDDKKNRNDNALLYSAYLFGVMGILALSIIDRLYIIKIEEQGEILLPFEQYFLLNTYALFPLLTIGGAMSFLAGGYIKRGIIIKTWQLSASSICFSIIYLSIFHNFVLPLLDEKLLVFSTSSVYALFAIKFTYMFSTGFIVFNENPKSLFIKSFSMLILIIIAIFISYGFYLKFNQFIFVCILLWALRYIIMAVLPNYK